MAWVMTIDETRAQKAGAKAFEALFFAEYSRVRAVALRTGLDAHEAEDVAQEAFVQFHRRHPPDAPFASAWLRRAAVHLSLNAMRTRRRRARREERDAVAAAATLRSAAMGLNPHNAIEDAERRSEVRAVMARLPARHAAVLALRYSGMSYAEVGAALEVPPSQVGMLLRRAESAFKKEFEHGSSR